MELIFKLNDIASAANWFLTNINTSRCIAFHGEMGAGKTTFISAVCNVLGVEHIASSPTFSIINEYSTVSGTNIYHIDLYRIKDEQEAVSAGVEDCFYSHQYCFVEWPEKAPRLFPDNTVHCFLITIDADTRKLKIIL